MTDLTNDELRALLEAATPGPWVIEADVSHYDTLTIVVAGAERKRPPVNQMCVSVGGFADIAEAEANAALIAAAPSLAAEVLALRAPRKASESQDDDGQEWSEAYLAWLRDLEERVIQGEHGYEPGEFGVYPESWAQMYEDGLTPDAAWRRAMEAHAQARRDEDAAQKARYELIKRDDQIAILSAERDRLSEEAAALREERERLREAGATLLAEARTAHSELHTFGFSPYGLVAAADRMAAALSGEQP